MKRILLLTLSMLMIIAITACSKKKEEPTTEENNNYAVNEVKEDTEEEEDTEDELSENTTEEEFVAKDQVYNVKQDKYAKDIVDMTTISIDGKVIGFPCTYQYAVEIFGQLNAQLSNKYTITYTPVDETLVDKSFEVYVLPTTGEGTIKLKFTADEDKAATITEMKCTEVTLKGGNTEGTEIMTCALPNSLTFGSTYEDIKNTFNDDNITHYETTHNDTEYRIRYAYPELNQCYEFTGHDNGLYIVTANYNYSEAE